MNMISLSRLLKLKLGNFANPTIEPTEPDHNGHSGLTISEMLHNRIDQMLEQAERELIPDIED